MHADRVSRALHQTLSAQRLPIPDQPSGTRCASSSTERFPRAGRSRRRLDRPWSWFTIAASRSPSAEPPSVATLIQVILALALVLPAWLAAVIVTVLVLAAAGIAALIGKRQVAAAGPLVPTESVRSVRLDVEGIK